MTTKDCIYFNKLLTLCTPLKKNTLFPLHIPNIQLLTNVSLVLTYYVPNTGQTGDHAREQNTSARSREALTK